MQCTAHKEVITKLEGPGAVNQAILAALDEYLFSSVQDLFKRIYFAHHDLATDNQLY
jgi:hypothetical protein